MSDQTNVVVQSLTIREASMATANTEKFLAVSAASADSDHEHSFALHKLVQHPQLAFEKTFLLCTSATCTAAVANTVLLCSTLTRVRFHCVPDLMLGTESHSRTENYYKSCERQAKTSR
jgi:hypothetical protein